MLLKRVTLERFCGFERFTADLGEFTVLIGPNNGGKTTVLRAVKFVTDAVRTVFGNREQPNLEVPRGKLHLATEGIARPLGVIDLDQLYYKKNRQVSGKVTVEMQNDENTYRVAVECEGPRNNAILVMSSGDRAVESFSEDEKAALVNNVYMFTAQFIPPPGTISASENTLTWNQLQNELAQGKFSETWRNQLDWDTEGKDPQRFQRVVIRVQQYLPDVNISYPKRSKLNNTVELIYSENGVAYDVSASGGGLRTLLTLATAIELSDARILLFDEPDSHLHSSVQRQAASLLHDAVSQGRQIIVATHAPDFIEECPVDCLVWVDKSLTEGRRCDEVGRALVDLGAITHTSAVQYLGADSVVYVEDSLDCKVLEQVLCKAGKRRLVDCTRFQKLGGYGDVDKLRGVLKVLKGLKRLDVRFAAILDADYTSDSAQPVANGVDGVLVLRLPCKELENLLLLQPETICEAVAMEIQRRDEHTAETVREPTLEVITSKIDELTEADDVRSKVEPQWLCSWSERKHLDLNDTGQLSGAQREFKSRWENPNWRRACCPGKIVMKRLRQWLQQSFNVSLGTLRIFDHYTASETLAQLFNRLEEHLRVTR